jgi:hypothetical protein
MPREHGRSRGQAIEAPASTGGSCSLDRKVAEMTDDRLYGSQLKQHVVGVEDLADIAADLFAELVGARS